MLVALWQQAQLGHAAGASGHSIATSSMVVHLVGAALWIGALAALALLVTRVGTDLSASVARYSVVAGWCFAAVGVSGLVNGLLRTGGWYDLTTTYGVLLLTKAALFGVLGLLGLAHRRRVLPRLAGGAGSATTRGCSGGSCWSSCSVMGAVSGVAVALGDTAPPVSEEPPVDPSPAYQITGHPLPPEPTPVCAGSPSGAGTWCSRSRPSPGSSSTGAGCCGCADAATTWSWLRAASWTVGMVLFGWATNGGPEPVRARAVQRRT